MFYLDPTWEIYGSLQLKALTMRVLKHSAWMIVNVQTLSGAFSIRSDKFNINNTVRNLSLPDFYEKKTFL